MKKILFCCCLLSLSFKTFAYRGLWASGGGVAVCAPEVQRETLQNLEDTMTVLFQSKIFDGQDELRQAYDGVVEGQSDNQKTIQFLEMIGFSFQSQNNENNEEELMTALSEIMGARDYTHYVDALELKLEISLTPTQKQEITSVLENLRGNLVE